MSFLQKALVHLALSRPSDALIKESGGTPRVQRGRTLDPRFQFLEAQARKRPSNWDAITAADIRAQTNAMVDMFGGALPGGVRTEQIYIGGRSHSVPARLYLPVVRDNTAAMMVYYHFGGGVIGTMECCHRLCGLIAKASGAPVLSVDYRLAPEHKFPAGLEDCMTAYNWALENAARYGAPAGKAAVGGDSMGGYFSAIVAQQTRGKNAPVLQLLIYPAVDLVSDSASMRDFGDAFPLTKETVEFFTREYLPAGADMNDLRVAPGREQNLSGLAPALVYTAGFDMLVDQGEDYANRLRAAGVKASYHCFDSLPHGFVAFPTAAPAAEQAIQRIARDTAAALKV